MKYSFYCLPLRKNVKGKVTAVVKKKSYSIKGTYRYKGNTYNLNKICSKSVAEQVSKESGIDITYPGEVVESAAEEDIDVAAVVENTFQPEGDGRIIGSNAAGAVTAIPGTEDNMDINATPFRSETDEDGIGPMHMAAETSKKLLKDSCCCGATKEKPCACMIQGVMYCTGDGDADPCPCAQERIMKKLGIGHRDIKWEDVGRKWGGPRTEYKGTLPKSAETVEVTIDDEPIMDTAMETFEISPDLYNAVQAHQDWDEDLLNFIHIYREKGLICIQAAGPFAQDVLDIIIDAQEFPLIEDDVYIDDRLMKDYLAEGQWELTPNAKTSFLGIGLGLLGLSAALLLYRQYQQRE